ncbi:rhodanese-like domain-containing protein [Bordetella trematum]|uniref:rhodanese-like domain-containing protein n=1 Tax=Bordetella trematum TaxID=123899 RepID=UPI00398A24DD
MTNFSSRSAAAVAPLLLKEWLHDGAEIALLDVREHGQYGESHLFYAVSLPWSRLELDIGRLVPRRSARVVVYDEGDGLARQAAGRLQALGYGEVYWLEGGTPAWRAAGLQLFAGVNVPSKTFGELAEHAFDTPRIRAEELAAMQARGEAVVIVDGRPYNEYRKMNIPGSICCPNGELALHIDTLVPDETTPIVVNCAGRTRSIIGAQTLINLGLPNPVYALENGTQGWFLADLKLEHGAQRRYEARVPAGALAQLRQRARAVAERFEVPVVDAATVRGWLDDGQRSVFLCDVRSAEEFAQGSLPGARHTPGGQLIQATDQYVGVRHARLVLFDGEGVRALVVASWLRQLGWDAVVLREGLEAALPKAPAEAALPPLPVLTVDALRTAQADGAPIVDVRPSMHYRRLRVAGAHWAIRARVEQVLALSNAAGGAPLTLIAEEAGVAALFAQSAQELGMAVAGVNLDGEQVWREAGLALAAGGDLPPDAECIDYLFFVHDRHDGNKAAARQYLAWETGLLQQIDARERATFRL